MNVTTRTEIPLNRAPEVFFDETLWSLFEIFFDTPEIALAQISQPPWALNYADHHADRAAERKDRWRETEQIFELKRILIEEFKDQIFKGDIIASGIPFDSRGRRRIEHYECNNLWFDFAEDQAYGILDNYEQIRLAINEETKPDAASLVDRCCAVL